MGKDGRLIITMDLTKSSVHDIDSLLAKLKRHTSVINVFIEDERHTQRFLGGKN